MPNRPDDPRARQPARPKSVTPGQRLVAPIELTPQRLTAQAVGLPWQSLERVGAALRRAPIRQLKEDEETLEVRNQPHRLPISSVPSAYCSVVKG